MITLLPALLVICGRWLFWPVRPRFGSPEPTTNGVWARLGRGLAHRPRFVWVTTTLALGAMALGLTQPQVYRFVLLPMAFRIVIPPLTSETMNLIKNSSIALTIGLAELTFRSREMGEYTFRFFEAFSAATLVYVVIAMTANRVMAVVERKVAVPGYIAGGGK